MIGLNRTLPVFRIVDNILKVDKMMLKICKSPVMALAEVFALNI